MDAIFIASIPEPSSVPYSGRSRSSYPKGGSGGTALFDGNDTGLPYRVNSASSCVPLLCTTEENLRRMAPTTKGTQRQRGNGLLSHQLSSSVLERSRQETSVLYTPSTSAYQQSAGFLCIRLIGPWLRSPNWLACEGMQPIPRQVECGAVCYTSQKVSDKTLR